MQTSARQHVDTCLFSWKQAAAIPDADGFAGAYAGVSNGALLVAGGANFPGDKRPWTGGVKTWYSTIFVLEQPSGAWKQAGKLPRPMGYGISLTYGDGVLCIGGGDARQNFADVFILKYRAGKTTITTLPNLPHPLINACGVIIQHTVYVVGGIQTPTDTAYNQCWSLDLSLPAGRQIWKALPSLPGASRMLAMAGTQGGRLFVFGGVHLVKKADATLQREYLKDAWQYTPGKGWKRIADLPYALAAAPTPAYAAGQHHLLLFGGDDGEKAAAVAELKDTHPGFRNEILGYHTRTDTWSVVGAIPVDHKTDSVNNPHGSVYAPVTTPLVVWHNQVVLAGGEARPAVRSNKVLMAAVKK